MVKVFVSGCFDIIHGGHIEFLRQAKALGDYLIVSFAGESSLFIHKNKKSSLPVEHKKSVLEALEMVDEVMVSNDEAEGLDFKSNFLMAKPDILAVTEDDRYREEKTALCKETGAKYVVLPKSLSYEKTSTSDIIRSIKAPCEVPIRVDFAGAWLDVPELSRTPGYIVNCTVTPGVSLNNWQYRIGSGIGGSAAYSILQGKNGVKAELEENHAGWQDPACILETGLCVWRSGNLPTLDFKSNPEWLSGKLAMLWTGKTHLTSQVKIISRDYDRIVEASQMAREAVKPDSCDIDLLGTAIDKSYKIQLDEGMEQLPVINELARKYLGSGWGGYALYIFNSSEEREKFLKLHDTIKIEPYIKNYE
jgi:cytidyltransferase-like protein